MMRLARRYRIPHVCYATATLRIACIYVCMYIPHPVNYDGFVLVSQSSESNLPVARLARIVFNCCRVKILFFFIYTFLVFKNYLHSSSVYNAEFL